MISTLLIFLLASVAAAATGLIFSPGPWYRALRKPSFTPPNFVFPLAWTTIYLLSAIAATRVASLAGDPRVPFTLALWGAQIALNTLWTPVFFGAHRMALGMAVIVALLMVVAALMVAFFQLDLWAGAMMLPYLAWLCVAAALNWRIWRDNPGAASV